jgi:hypothetical protein
VNYDTGTNPVILDNRVSILIQTLNPENPMRATIIAVSTIFLAVGIWFGLHGVSPGADGGTTLVPVKYTLGTASDVAPTKEVFVLKVTATNTANPADNTELYYRTPDAKHPLFFATLSACQAVMSSNNFKDALDALAERFKAAGFDAAIVPECDLINVPEDEQSF